jgi:hypothetical protein
MSGTPYEINLSALRQPNLPTMGRCSACLLDLRLRPGKHGPCSPECCEKVDSYGVPEIPIIKDDGGLLGS